MVEAPEVLSSALEKLVKAVEQASPEIWAAAQAGVQAQAAICKFYVQLAIGMEIVAMVWLAFWVWLFLRSDDEDALGIGLIPFLLLTLIAVVMGAVNYTELLTLQLAPQWAAIQLLLQQVR